MKSRLESAPLTSEDLDIWWDKVHWGTSTVLIGALGCVSIETDRRDADLMFRAQDDRTCSIMLAYPHDPRRDRSATAIDVRGIGAHWVPL